MKHRYQLIPALLTALLLLAALRAEAQAWRPFRSGLIYSFTTSSSGSNPTGSYLMRLDSAYTTTSGDSAWTFNRVLRPVDGNALNRYSYSDTRKSRNNLFGARLLWRPGTKEYVLENIAEGTYQAALTLRLHPNAAVGSTWAASASPALTATLTSRAWQPVNGTAGSPSDSISTITLSSGAVLRLSRQYGLLAAPRWLAVAGAAAPQWEINHLPMTLATSPLYPAALFDMQPGDLLGYLYSPVGLGGPPCQERYTLRAIQTRQIVGDSLVYTYREQVRTQTYTAGCGGPIGTSTAPAYSGRLAFSLRTGQSPQFRALALLSGEYRLHYPASSLQILVTGLGLNPLVGGGGCLTGNSLLTYQDRYPRVVNGQNLYGALSDGNWQQQFGYELGVGDWQTNETSLVYYRRTTSNGTVATCGQAASFANLLPSRAVQATTLATLHPNPAAESTVVTLEKPVQVNSSLQLTDALGRRVWSAPLLAGQRTVVVPLAGQPVGMYLLQLIGPRAVATWKLHHE